MNDDTQDYEDLVDSLESMAYIVDECVKNNVAVLMISGRMFKEAAEEIIYLREKLEVIGLI
jgi:hypothetical protein